ncbi:MAG TPA: GDYXXLXY domain-containing protein [Candidatus Didemnitutus sp.]
MRRILIIVVIAAQAGVLAWMAAGREWILRRGERFLVRSAGADPQDPMRGAYARLQFELSNVDRSLWRDGLPTLVGASLRDSRSLADTPVFASLRVNDSGLAVLAGLSDRRPAQGPFVRGRIESVSGDIVHVRYGIEAMFMEQDAATKFDQERARLRPGAPMDVEIAVSSDGTAVLRGVQWESLGLVATFERDPVPPANPPNPPGPGNRPRIVPPRQFIARVRLEWKNYGDKEIAIAIQNNAGLLRLVPNVRASQNHYRWVGEGLPPARVEAASIIVLPPGGSHVETLDLTQPAWFVIDKKARPDSAKPIALRDVTDPWAASFRIEYVPPSRTEVAALPHADRMAFSSLVTRAFSSVVGGD